MGGDAVRVCKELCERVSSLVVVHDGKGIRGHPRSSCQDVVHRARHIVEGMEGHAADLARTHPALLCDAPTGATQNHREHTSAISAKTDAAARR